VIICRKGGRIEHAHAAVADEVRVRKPDIRSSVCGSDSQERLDGTALVHRGVVLDDAVRVGAVVEHAAGVDANFKDSSSNSNAARRRDKQKRRGIVNATLMVLSAFARADPAWRIVGVGRLAL
jgi:hypothetical protein